MSKHGHFPGVFRPNVVSVAKLYPDGPSLKVSYVTGKLNGTQSVFTGQEMWNGTGQWSTSNIVLSVLESVPSRHRVCMELPRPTISVIKELTPCPSCEDTYGVKLDEGKFLHV